MTFNEPWVITWLGYGIGVFAPGIYEPAEGQYKTSHTIIKAHAEAWHVYNDNYRSTQKGNIIFQFHLQLIWLRCLYIYDSCNE